MKARGFWLAAIVSGITIGAIASAAAQEPAAVPSARPAPWSRLPDGRLVVEILGQQLGLPTDEPQPDLIVFTADGQHQMSLRAAMAEPGRAEALFTSARGNVNVTISTPEVRGSRDGGLVLLGVFRRDPEPVGLYLSVTIFRQPQDWRNVEYERLWSKRSAPDGLGYVSKTGPIHSGRRTPDEIRFRLPAEKRLWSTPADLLVDCADTAAARWNCHIRLYSRRGLIQVSSGFYWKSTIPRDPTFEQSEWTRFDKRQREIADYVLLNSHDGELE